MADFEATVAGLRGPSLTSEDRDAIDGAGDFANAAALSATAAQIASPIYPDTTAGLAATAADGYFNVVGSGTSSAILYRKVGGVPVEQTRYPSNNFATAPFTMAGPVTMINGAKVPYDGKIVFLNGLGVDDGCTLVREFDAIRIDQEIRLTGQDASSIVCFGGKNMTSAAAVYLATDVNGDTQNRFHVTIGGAMSWGPGDAVRDTLLYRVDPNRLRLEGSIIIDGITNCGQGVQFPATQVPSANANCLDDYEEGTFTPTVKFGGATTGITYATQVGRYTKIGRFVNVEIDITLTSKGSASGDFALDGLPFACGPNVGAVPAAYLMTGVSDVQMLQAAGATAIQLFDVPSNGTPALLNNTHFTNVSVFRASYGYSV